MGIVIIKFYAGIFGDFNLSSMQEIYLAELTKLLLTKMLTITYLILMNALISFMGNTFGRVLGEKIHVPT